MSDHGGEYFERIVDVDALASYLESELGPVSDDAYRVERHEEGHSNETLFVEWGERELVVRRPPPGETAEKAHDVLREHTVIGALQDTGVRVPTTVAATDDHSIIGSDFYVMEREDGVVLRDGVPEQFDAPAYRRAIGRELVDRLTEIHQVDYEAVGLGDFGYPEGFTQRQVDRWAEQLEWAFEVTADEREVPALVEVTEWLRANVPAEYPHTLVHGDYRLENVMYGHGTPPGIVSILDWEMSTLGDPFTDLGWMLSLWWDPGDPDPPDTATSTFTAHEEFPRRTDLVERYEAATGFEFQNDQFYRALSVYKSAALGEMFFRRYLEDNADDPRYPKMRGGVPGIADRARRIVEGEEPL